MSKRVKIKDIAEKCGFSNTLVSLVLNDKASIYGIKPETQEKVLFVARQMGYFKDIPAAGDASKPSAGSLIGMVVPNLDNHFLFNISPMLSNAFSSIGLTFSVIARNENEHRFNYVLDELKKMYCGLILYGDAADDITVRSLKESSYPFVVLEKNLVNHRTNQINTDTDEMCRLVASLIQRLGYQSVSIIEHKNPQNCLIDTRLLIEKINKTANCKKLSVQTLKDTNEIKGTDADELARALRPPLASEVFVVKNTESVYPLLSYFRKKRIRVPGDVALIALDSGIGFDLIDPPVTRITRKYSQLALKTSQMLWSEVKNNGKGKYKRSVKVSPELIIEKSCGSVV